MLKMAGKLKRIKKVKKVKLVKDDRQAKLVMWGLFGTGLAGLGLEVLWTRMLVLWFQRMSMNLEEV